MKLIYIRCRKILYHCSAKSHRHLTSLSSAVVYLSQNLEIWKIRERNSENETDQKNQKIQKIIVKASQRLRERKERERVEIFEIFKFFEIPHIKLCCVSFISCVVVI